MAFASFLKEVLCKYYSDHIPMDGCACDVLTNGFANGPGVLPPGDNGQLSWERGAEYKSGVQIMVCSRGVVGVRELF